MATTRHCWSIRSARAPTAPATFFYVRISPYITHYIFLSRIYLQLVLWSCKLPNRLTHVVIIASLVDGYFEDISPSPSFLQSCFVNANVGEWERVSAVEDEMTCEDRGLAGVGTMEGGGAYLPPMRESCNGRGLSSPVGLSRSYLTWIPPTL